MKKIVNLTPHEIVVRLPGGEERRFPPSGAVARVDEVRAKTFDIDGIPVQALGYGQVDFGIDLAPGTVYIVSAMVLGAIGRDTDLNGADVLAPDTGRAIRDADGRIVAVPGFVSRIRQ